MTISINVSSQLGQNDIKTYENIQKTVIGDGDCHKNGWFHRYPYFKEN